MVSILHQCIFVHIPKVAGQSIEHCFLKLNGLDWARRDQLLLKHNPNPSLGPTRLAHLTASEYVSFGHITNVDFKKLFKFSFVRNPWDRFVSEYEFRKRERCNWCSQLDFKTFLFNLPPLDGPSDASRHLLPQHCFLFSKSQGPLVDFIGRFENLQADFSLVCRELNISPDQLPHVNRSPGRANYRDYFDSESKELVAKLYQTDIDLFKYSF
jgi:hypothetical protein